mmetsp:Transcript_24681/g.33862  ORF Transcript_24681/g.33862 Transcript_24681/m.33862 type:complete len:248 (+) Transcript_24681:1-744(+)
MDFRRLFNDRKELVESGASEIDDALGAMVREDMSLKDVEDHFVTLVCAGHDTTAFFTSYMCYLLAAHPEKQEKLWEEINSVLDGQQDITMDSITELKYLNQVMQETLRLYSIIPMITRYCTEEHHIPESGVTIPKGAYILIPLFLINRDPELWDNPSEFIPERFADKGMEFTSAKAGFFPFGYGVRVCIGNILAQTEAAIFICHLLRAFHLEAVPGFKPVIQAGISLTTSNGIFISLRKRNSLSVEQ